MIDTHLKGSFLVIRHGVKAMASAGHGGRIINIGSMYSLFGPPVEVHDELVNVRTRSGKPRRTRGDLPCFRVSPSGR